MEGLWLLGSEVWAGPRGAHAPKGEMSWAPDAERRWVDAYNGELAAEHDGMLGAIAARDNAQVLRLAVAYAVLDGRRVIEPGDVAAGLAV